jgi:multidrug efflux system outer membrane protein
MTQHILTLRSLRCLAALLPALSLVACAIVTDLPAPPAADLPSTYDEAGQSGAAVAAADWWRGFDSDELSVLVAATLERNPDLAIAAERVRQAEAQVRIADASLFPSLSLGAGASWRETREPGAETVSANSYNAALSASYELDLWGRNAALARSADFSLRATRFDLETARLTLVSGVASAYFQVQSLRAQLVIVRENLAIAERVFKVVDARARNGAASPLDVARQRSAVLTQTAALPPLELQERQTLFALALLVGRPPEGFMVKDLALRELTVPSVSAGLPATLLLRRPDLASAEAQLSSANANLTSARAALLPGIQLTGSAGAASDALRLLIQDPTLVLSIGASLLQPIFDGGRLRAQVDIARSRQTELVLAYRKAILAALTDVETALAAGSRVSQREVLLEQVRQQAARAMQLAEVRYREGADDLLVLLDAQRTLFQAQDQLVQIRLARLQATLSLFKALGGGWQKN